MSKKYRNIFHFIHANGCGDFESKGAPPDPLDDFEWAKMLESGPSATDFSPRVEQMRKRVEQGYDPVHPLEECPRELATAYDAQEVLVSSDPKAPVLGGVHIRPSVSMHANLDGQFRGKRESRYRKDGV